MVCGSLDQNAWANYEGAAKFLESTRLRDGRVRAWCLSSANLTTDTGWDTSNREPWRAGATSLWCFWGAVRRHTLVQGQDEVAERAAGDRTRPHWTARLGALWGLRWAVRSPACGVRGVGGSGWKVGCRAGEG